MMVHGINRCFDENSKLSSAIESEATIESFLRKELPLNDESNDDGDSRNVNDGSKKY